MGFFFYKVKVKRRVVMKLSALPLVIVFTGTLTFAYFWEDLGKRTTPEERIKKEEVDLKLRCSSRCERPLSVSVSKAEPIRTMSCKQIILLS